MIIPLRIVRTNITNVRSLWLRIMLRPCCRCLELVKSFMCRPAYNIVYEMTINFKLWLSVVSKRHDFLTNGWKPLHREDVASCEDCRKLRSTTYALLEYSFVLNSCISLSEMYFIFITFYCYRGSSVFKINSCLSAEWEEIHFMKAAKANEMWAVSKGNARIRQRPHHTSFLRSNSLSYPR
jgi:hypothetical protein